MAHMCVHFAISLFFYERKVLYLFFSMRLFNTLPPSQRIIHNNAIDYTVPINLQFFTFDLLDLSSCQCRLEVSKTRHY